MQAVVDCTGMTITVTDKRAYRPICPFCLDTGCPLCETKRAQILAARLSEEEASSLQKVVEEFALATVGTKRSDNYVEVRLPQTPEQLLDLLYAAMAHAIERERGSHSEASSEPFDATQERFKRLELDTALF